MGEAILGRASSSIISGSGSSSGLKTEIFTDDFCWVAPKAKNQTFSVRIFGGGGSGYIGGGGGGYMNNGEFQINEGESVLISIGRGGFGTSKFYKYMNTSIAYTTNSHYIGTYFGYASKAGGTTSFGTLLSAAGGGGAVQTNSASTSGGGSGGSGGGAGDITNFKYSQFGGDGFQFGGGGGCNNTGNGGTWGGNGGRGEYSSYGVNGTNTVGTEPDNLSGIGVGGGTYGGDGGYGGCGGNAGNEGRGYGVGGGGGYGANGGAGYEYTASIYSGNYVGACGGGGGYSKLGKGGDGGYVAFEDCYSINENSNEYSHYNSNSNIPLVDFHCGGGGGAYGPGGSVNIKPLYGGGGSMGYDYGRGADGICIIQYYT